MDSDIFYKKAKKEENLFLSLCSSEDKLKLTKQIPMTFNDFLRITCIVTFMDLTNYNVQLNELFKNFSDQKQQMLKRQNDIFSDYADYYKDEGSIKKIHVWLTEFCNQISDKSQQKKYRKKFNLNHTEWDT